MIISLLSKIWRILRAILSAFLLLAAETLVFYGIEYVFKCKLADWVLFAVAIAFVIVYDLFFHSSKLEDYYYDESEVNHPKRFFAKMLARQKKIKTSVVIILGLWEVAIVIGIIWFLQNSSYDSNDLVRIFGEKMKYGEFSTILAIVATGFGIDWVFSFFGALRWNCPTCGCSHSRVKESAYWSEPVVEEENRTVDRTSDRSIQLKKDIFDQGQTYHCSVTRRVNESRLIERQSGCVNTYCRYCNAGKNYSRFHYHELSDWEEN